MKRLQNKINKRCGPNVDPYSASSTAPKKRRRK